MDLRVNNSAQPTFKRLIWREESEESTRYAISEIMRNDANKKGSLSFETLNDQFQKIDDFEDDVVVNCSCSGDGENGIFGMFARNKRGTMLADTTLYLMGDKKKVNETASTFADDVWKKLWQIKNARKLTKEQQKYYDAAKDYMKEFDTKA